MAGYASEEEEAPCNLDAEVAQFVTKLHADGLLPAGELPSGLLPLGDQGYPASARGTQSLPRQQPTAEELDGFSHIPTACIEASGSYLEQIPKVSWLECEMGFSSEPGFPLCPDSGLPTHARTPNGQQSTPMQYCFAN